MSILLREREVLKMCLQLLELRKIAHVRINTGAFPLGEGAARRYLRTAVPGTPDILGLLPQWSTHPGRFLALEIKSATGKTSPEQEAFLECVRFHQGLAVVIRDVMDLDEFLAELNC